MRRVHVNGGNVSLMDYCTAGPQYASGGFIADSRSPATVINGSQQQFFTRNSSTRRLVERRLEPGLLRRRRAPRRSRFPTPPYTTLATTPGVPREAVPVRRTQRAATASFVPAAQTNSRGTTWPDGPTPGRSLPLSTFFVAQAGATRRDDQRRARAGQEPAAARRASTTSTARHRGQAGRHRRARPRPRDADRPSTARPPMAVADVPRRRHRRPHRSTPARSNSPALAAGRHAARQRGAQLERTPADPTALQDVFFRVGGPHVGKATDEPRGQQRPRDPRRHLGLARRPRRRRRLDGEHRRHRRRRQRRRRHRHRAVRRALPEVQRDLERRAAAGRSSSRTRCRTTRRTRPRGSTTACSGYAALQGGRHGAHPRGVGAGQLHLHERRPVAARHATRSRCR